MTHAKNDLVLIVINDGNGSQCGMTYDQRCAAAATGIDQFRYACQKANQWRIAHDCPSATRADVFAAASEVYAYYRNHMAESRAMIEAGEIQHEDLQAAASVYDKLASGSLYPVGTKFIDGTVQS
jgi:hypothetical protein